MCSPTRCRQCGLTTWSGCGQHVAQVRAAVPPENWCGGDHPAGSTGHATNTQTAKPDDDRASRGWLRRVLGS